MKILFVFTGGTIGSENVDGVADVSLSVSQAIPELINSDIDMEFAFPINMLSENATADSLSKILTFMLSLDYDKYDGVIVTHGSDTLAYTSTLLCTALSWVKIPIVLTAANFVISDPRSNAKDNLNAAAAFIISFKQHHHCGVYAAWKNPGELPQIHFGERLLEADDCDRFRSYGGDAFGIIENGKYRDTSPCVSCFGEKTAFLKNRSISLCSSVLLIHSYPGLDFSSVDTVSKAAVLLKLYHSATACTEGETTSVTALIKSCRNTDTALYMLPRKQSGYIYSSEKAIDKDIVRYLPDMSEYAAYTLLLLAYSLEDEERDSLLTVSEL